MQGPILVLGASGFIGQHLFKELSRRFEDVYGTSTIHMGLKNLVQISDLCDKGKVETLIYNIKPKTIFNLVAYGNYEHDTDTERIFATNLRIVNRIFNSIGKDTVFINAGSSSEYGKYASGPAEIQRLTPNSIYGVAKAAASLLIEHKGFNEGYTCAHLRLYSVYGPGEPSLRLMPQLVACAKKKRLPLFVSADVSRDFVYVDDVVKAFIRFAELKPQLHGQAYNIGTGTPTTMRALASLAKDVFQIEDEPVFNGEPRVWDHYVPWYANTVYASAFWKAETSLAEGLRKMAK
jgi:dolichol-phosphate mannosyltransferase